MFFKWMQIASIFCWSIFYVPSIIGAICSFTVIIDKLYPHSMLITYVRHILLIGKLRNIHNFAPYLHSLRIIMHSKYS